LGRSPLPKHGLMFLLLLQSGARFWRRCFCSPRVGRRELFGYSGKGVDFSMFISIIFPHSECVFFAGYNDLKQSVTSLIPCIATISFRSVYFLGLSERNYDVLSPHAYYSSDHFPVNSYLDSDETSD